VSTIALGIIGLGNMGRGIASNIARAGYETAVWDVAPRALRPFEGRRGIAVLPPAAMARRCAAIFFVVPSSAEIAPMLRGPNGILANARHGLVLYDLTTSDPAKTQRLATAAAGRGVAYLDAGMSGGATGAEAGTLTLMIGGDAAAYRRTRRFLAPFTRNLFHLGQSGTGHILKLIHNMVCHTNFLATCEGGRMAARAGIKLEDMIAVFNCSNARSYASEVRFPRHILSGKWDGRSRVYNLHKDLSMAASLAGRLGADVTLGRRTLAFLRRGIARGMENQDFTLLYRDFERLRKTR
jgi:3-hydroxyisobutyrate dehydrogenase